MKEHLNRMSQLVGRLEKLNETLVNEVDTEVIQLTPDTSDPSILKLKIDELLDEKRKQSLVIKELQQELSSKRLNSNRKLIVGRQSNNRFSFTLEPDQLTKLNGFGAPERDTKGVCFCWTEGQTTVDFDVKIQPDPRLFLEIEIRAIIKPEYLDSLVLSANGIKLDTQLWVKNTSTLLLRAPLPFIDANSAAISLQIPQVHAPVSLGIGVDERLLGLAICRINVVRRKFLWKLMPSLSSVIIRAYGMLRR